VLFHENSSDGKVTLAHRNALGLPSWLWRWKAPRGQLEGTLPNLPATLLTSVNESKDPRQARSSERARDPPPPSTARRSTPTRDGT